jgi:hypothetical protein
MRRCNGSELELGCCQPYCSDSVADCGEATAKARRGGYNAGGMVPGTASPSLFLVNRREHEDDGFSLAGLEEQVVICVCPSCIYAQGCSMAYVHARVFTLLRPLSDICSFQVTRTLLLRITRHYYIARYYTETISFTPAQHSS